MYKQTQTEVTDRHQQQQLTESQISTGYDVALKCNQIIFHYVYERTSWSIDIDTPTIQYKPI